MIFQTMYYRYLIKNIKDNKEMLGDDPNYIPTTLIEAQLKQSFWSKLIKKTETAYFTVLTDSTLHKRAKSAFTSDSSWEIDLDDFTHNHVVGREMFLAKDIAVEKEKRAEARKVKRTEQKAKQQAEEQVKQRKPEAKKETPKPKASIQKQAPEEVDLNNIQPCFNPMALPKVKMTEQFSMHPITETNLENDAHTLSIMLMFDNDTRKYMHDFAGPEAREKIPMYLVNSVMTQSMGIAFCYIIRMNAGICGLIKVTSPTHNKVTNNFNHWLIDYILIPPLRGHKIMKSALPIVFDIMKNRLGINDPVYAMVIPGNDVSIHLLELNGFKLDESSGMSVDPTTGDRALVYKKLL